MSDYSQISPLTSTAPYLSPISSYNISAVPSTPLQQHYLPRIRQDPMIGQQETVAMPNFYHQEPVGDSQGILNAVSGDPLGNGPFFSAEDASWLFEDFAGSSGGVHSPMQQVQPSQPQEPTYEEIPFTSSGPLPAVYQSTQLPALPGALLQPGDASTFISENTRRRLLHYLTLRRGCFTFSRNAQTTAQAIPELEHDPRFSSGTLSQCLALFWIRSNTPHYPLLHRPTFRTEQTPIPLLLSIILIGSYHMAATMQPLAQQIHRISRGLLICSSDFRPRAELWLIQCTLFVQLYGKMCADRRDHEMAHILFGSYLTLYRRSALFAQRPYRVPDHLRHDIEGRWRYFVEAESIRRAAYGAFEIDMNHAAFFRHSPTLSAFQMQPDMPCDEDLWTASNAYEWDRLMQHAAPPQRFLSALKSTLGRTAPVNLSPCARINLLHGLLSVAFDLQWRDQFQAGMSSPDAMSNDWRASHLQVLSCWKHWYDKALNETRGPGLALLRGALPIYVLCQIVIGLNLHDLQLYAGARHSLGLSVDPRLVQIAKTKVSAWAVTHEGRVATWHAAHFLRSALPEARSISQPTSLYYSWVLFFCALVVFAYGSAVDGQMTGRADRVETATTYLDHMCTAAPDGIAGIRCKADCSAVLEEVAGILSHSRWEIAHEAVDILRSLTSGPD